jgi:VWFA-related protein
VRRGGFLRAALLLPAGLTLASTTARPAPQRPPEFATQAELVTVDVVVLDRDGKPVPDLKRADFVVTEDGRPQKVTAFEAVEARLPALTAPETVASAPSVSRLATNVAGPPTRRTFAIVFDDLRVGDVNIEQAKRAVEAFVEKDVRPGDRLVLFTTSDARFWATTRGPADAGWREALRGVRSHERLPVYVGCQITHYEAMRIEDANDTAVQGLVSRRLAALCPDGGLRADAAAIARRGGASAGAARAPAESGPVHSWDAARVYAEERGQLASSLRVVREVTRSLGATPGRKALVLVTEGFPVDPSLDVIREVREQAARANVALSFLDARGLPVGPSFLSAAGTTPAIPAPDMGPTLALWRLNEEGPKILAKETGGLVLQTNDLVSGLERVADESRVTYLLGYEPTNARRDGRYRKLKVEVLRPGLEVRARAGYFAAKGKEKPAPEPSVVRRALRSPFDADGIPLRLAAYVMGPAPLESPVPKTGVEVLVAGEVRLDALETRVKDGRLAAEPKLTLLAGARSGELHESAWTLEVALAQPPDGAEPAKAWHPFLTRIAMEPGDHRARLVVESGGKVGSVTTDFIVPDFTEERLSTPILSDQLVSPEGLGARRPGERRVMPVVRRSFPVSSTLQCWFELHGAAIDSDTGQPRATAGFVARTADGREWASGAETAMSVESGKPTRLVSVPLADAPEGESELVLTVRDEVSGRSFEAREPFRVEGVAAR